MGLSGILGNLLQQYTGESASATHATGQHFEQVAQSVDPSTLASGLGAMMRSSDTPAFGQIVGQLFGNGSGDQKAGMLNALLGSASPAVLSQLASLVPGLASGGTISPQQAQAIPAGAVSQMAAQAESHDPSIIDKMSSLYAAHPTLVKTLGTGAMMIALREIGKRYSR
jgi:hypothetical protein